MKNNKKIFMIISALLLGIISERAHGMMRRLAPRMVPGIAATTAASMLRTPQRTLLPGQEKLQPWIDINKKIEEFKFEHGITNPTDEEIQSMKKYFVGDDLDLFLKKCGYKRLKDKRLKKIIDETLLKHDIDPTSIACVQINDSRRSTLMFVDLDFVLGVNIGRIAKIFDKEVIVALVEHEISHILYKDSCVHTYLRGRGHSQDVLDKFGLLYEQRADTHSALQSLLNAKIGDEFCRDYAEKALRQKYCEARDKELDSGIIDDIPKFMKSFYTNNKLYTQELVDFMRNQESNGLSDFNCKFRDIKHKNLLDLFEAKSWCLDRENEQKALKEKLKQLQKEINQKKQQIEKDELNYHEKDPEMWKFFKDQCGDDATPEHRRYAYDRESGCCVLVKK